MFIGKYNKSLIITYLGVAFAIIGMFFALSNNLQYAMVCMVIAGVCDMFDGKVARLCKRDEEEKKFGVEIDSLADMVAFVTFPVVIGYSMGLNSWYNILSYILLVLAGITRLGFFNISVSHNVSFKSIYTVLIYLIAFLFVFNAKIPKIKGKAYIFVTVAAIIGILLILFLV